VVTDDDAPVAKVHELIQRTEILECLHRYARGMDRHDRELARSAYHDDAIDVHGSVAFTVDDFLDWAFAYHAQQSHHQHYLMNPTIEVSGDTAHAETYYLFVGRYPDRDTPLTMVGGRYVDRLDRRDGRWAIAKRVCTAEWRTTPSSHLPDRGEAAVVPPVIVSQDRDDVSYVRPLAVRLATRPASLEDDIEPRTEGTRP
jgi:hypothetical protein